eukprot:gene3333-3610_t
MTSVELPEDDFVHLEQGSVLEAVSRQDAVHSTAIANDWRQLHPLHDSASRPAHGNSNTIIEENVGVSGGSIRPKQLQQTTLFEALQLAKHKKGAVHQRDGDKTDKQQQAAVHGAGGSTPSLNDLNDEGAAGMAGASIGLSAAGGAAAKRKRKSRSRSGNAAGDEAVNAQPSGGPRSHAGSGSGRGAKAPRRGAAAADDVLQEAVEELDLWLLTGSTGLAASSNATSPLWGLLLCLQAQHTWQQLQQALSVAEGVVLGLLCCKRVGQAVQYYSSIQPISKHQLQLLRKAAVVQRRHAAAEAQLPLVEDDPQGYTAGSQEVVGIGIMPVTAEQAEAASARLAAHPSNHSSPASSSSSLRMFYMHVKDFLSPGIKIHSLTAKDPDQLQQLADKLSPAALVLLQDLLWSSSRPCVCPSAQAVLCSLSHLGLPLTQLPASDLAVLDPEVLAWLQDPQLVQDSKDVQSVYTLQEQFSRLGHEQASGASARLGPGEAGPLQRLYHQMEGALQMCGFLLPRLRTKVAVEAIQAEMQASSSTSDMTADGPEPPKGTRGSAKSHLPTDEAALLQLAHRHELPNLVIEYRSIQNVLTKWVDSAWIQAASYVASSNPDRVTRVRCSWNQLATATGRLSSSNPNLQAVTKYTIAAHALSQHLGTKPGRDIVEQPQQSLLQINIRDVFMAPAGKLLLSADYSQLELRLLAHFSGDMLLQRLLQQSGAQGDVFSLIAEAWLQPAGQQTAAGIEQHQTSSGTRVTPEMRERAKKVTYGIVYGLSAFGLAQQLSEQGVTKESAQQMINSFLSRFAGVRRFIADSLAAAQQAGAVRTLHGRVRPIAGLDGPPSPARQAAERKVVNSIIQGSAADLVKLAMCSWEAATTTPITTSSDAQPTSNRPDAGAVGDARESPVVQGARLVAQIHDELLFEVNAVGLVLAADGSVQGLGDNLLRVAGAVKRIMEGAVALRVPLRVNITVGTRWGSMAPVCLP